MMKNSVWLFLIICFTIVESINCQTDISIYAGGGINYIPVSDFHDYGTSSNSHLDEISFNGNIGAKYYLDIHKAVYFEIEYISSNAVIYSGISSVIGSIPITLGYQQFIYSGDDCFNPYVGLGLSFVIVKTELNVLTDCCRYEKFLTDYSAGIEIKVGFTKSLAEKLRLIAEAKYRLQGNVDVNKPYNHNDVTLSGAALIIGFEVAM